MTPSLPPTSAAGHQRPALAARSSSGPIRRRPTSSPGCSPRSLEAAGAWPRSAELTVPALLAADRGGHVQRLSAPAAAGPAAAGERRRRGRRRVALLAAELARRRPADRDRAAAAAEHCQLAIGIAGAGLRRQPDLGQHPDRRLRRSRPTSRRPSSAGSASTVPREMSGSRSAPRAAPTSARWPSLGDRLAAIPSRRGLRDRPQPARLGSSPPGSPRLLGRRPRRPCGCWRSRVVYLPLVLLLGAALSRARPSTAPARRSAPRALAALTLAASAATGRSPWPAALTVLAYAVDVIAGSPLTSLSLLGPNPGLGRALLRDRQRARGAAGRARDRRHRRGARRLRPRLSRARRGVAFLAVGLVAAFVFAAGRFGADVGAAIVFPSGAAVAAAAIGQRPAPLALLALAAPLAGARPAGPDRPRLRRRCPPDPLGARRRRPRRPRRRRPAPPASSRRISFGRADRLAVFLPLVGGGGWRSPSAAAIAAAWLRGAPAMRAGLLGRPRGDPGRHARQRLRRPAARDRHRLPARLLGLRLGREGGTGSQARIEAVRPGNRDPQRGLSRSRVGPRLRGPPQIRHRNINYP